MPPLLPPYEGRRGRLKAAPKRRNQRKYFRMSTVRRGNRIGKQPPGKALVLRERREFFRGLRKS
jgi:hypothetical protein